MRMGPGGANLGVNFRLHPAMPSGRISRRSFASATVLAAAALARAPLGAQTRPERPHVSIAVNNKGAMTHLPLTVAEQLGFFKAEGLEVEVFEAQPGGPAGDVTCAPFDRALGLVARGAAMQAFVLLGRTPAIALGASARAMPGLRAADELRGRRIGVPAIGSTAHLVAAAAMAKAGVPAAELTFVPVGGMPAAPQAVRAGQVDALCAPDPAMTLLEQRAEVRVVADTRTLKGTLEIFGGPVPGGCLYAPAEFVQKYPATCQALTYAIVHALKWLRTAGPRDMIRTVPEAYLLGDRALYLAAFEKLRESISIDGVIAPEAASAAARALSTFDPIARGERLELARAFTNEFARRAKERFHA